MAYIAGTDRTQAVLLPEVLKGVCREFILLCKRLDLFGGELLAIDGSKFRAVNARDRSYTAARLKVLVRHIDGMIAHYLRQLERQDQHEAGSESPSAATLRDHIAALQQRRARYEALQQEVAASGATAISLSDPDSRPMKSGAGIEICYNVQTAVDAKHKLIVAETVTNAAGDRDQLSALAVAAQEVLEAPAPVVVADQGYYHGAEIKICLEAGITPLVPRPITPANAKRVLFTKDDFLYRCTRNKDGRKITRWADEHLLEEMAQRLQREQARFAQRKALAEHPFGTMKRGTDQGYFLLKGLRKVRGEFSLTVLAYNLKRVLNIVGGAAAARRPRVEGGPQRRFSPLGEGPRRSFCSQTPL